MTVDEGTERAACRLVRQGTIAEGKQGLAYSVGISAETVGSRHLHLQLLTIPPGGRARAHRHVGHETAIYALRGTSSVWHGEQLEQHSTVAPGEFFYIPPGAPHLPYNASSSEEGCGRDLTKRSERTGECRVAAGA